MAVMAVINEKKSSFIGRQKIFNSNGPLKKKSLKIDKRWRLF